MIAMLMAFMPQARADAGIEDFYVTNSVTSGISLINAPTNAAGLNTGHFIEVRNEDELGIEVRGTFISTNTTDKLIVTIGRASVSGTPTWLDFDRKILDGGNAWTFGIPYVTTGDFGAGVTNALIWHTNVPTLFMRSATHVGVVGITNSALTTSGSNSVVQVRAIKKHIPPGSL